MKKIWLLLFVSILVVAFVGCGNKDAKDKEDKEVVKDNEDDNEKMEDLDNGEEAKDKDEEVDTEAEAEELDTQDSDAGEASDENLDIDLDNIDLAGMITYDSSLEGEALLNSIEFGDLENILMKTGFIIEMNISYFGEMAQEMTTFMIRDKDNRIYSEYKSIDTLWKTIILNSDEATTTYMFSDMDEQGYIYVEENDEGMDENSDSELLEFYDPEYQTLIDAHVEKLDDKEVIYFEVAETEYPDSIMKYWYYPEFNYPVKVETYYDGNLESSQVVTRFEYTNNFDENYFVVPEDIEFVDGGGFGF